MAINKTSRIQHDTPKKTGLLVLSRAENLYVKQVPSLESHHPQHVTSGKNGLQPEPHRILPVLAVHPKLQIG